MHCSLDFPEIAMRSLIASSLGYGNPDPADEDGCYYEVVVGYY
jgi:hypothetical protein